MKGPLVLLAHSFKRVRTIVIAMGVLLVIFQVFLIIVAGSIQRSNTFEQMGALMPPFVRELLGPSFASLMSFGGIVCLGYFHLAVMGSLVALSIAMGTMPTSEIETGFMDLILSRPLARHWIITRSIIVVTVCTISLLAMMIAATWAGLNGLAPKGAAWPSLDLIISLAINLGLLMLCWGGVAMAVGAAARRRGVAGAATGLLALATFLLDYVARAWQPAETVAWLSPFRYHSPFELLMGKALPVGNIVVLTGIAVAGFALAYFLFSRRDISR
jgi:beta-exotoxin I transport system permease protein